MRRILLFLSFFLAFTVAQAQTNSNLTISTTGNTNLKIRFAGKQYSLLDRTVTFQNLQPGNYAIAIYQLQKRFGRNDEYVEVYNSNITLSPKKHLEIAVLRFGKVMLDEGFIEADNWNNGSYNPSGSNNNNNQGNNNSIGYPVSNEQFLLLKKSMANAYYDNDKLIAGKVILKNNLFTTAQIKELLKLFYNDEQRLEFAKLAYDYCTDKGSYITLQDVFYYTTSKTELLNYIKDK